MPCFVVLGLPEVCCLMHHTLVEMRQAGCALFLSLFASPEPRRS